MNLHSNRSIIIRRNVLSLATAFGLALVSVAPGVAVAADTTTAAQQQQASGTTAQSAPASVSSAPVKLQAVTVTGSLIAAPNEVSASPIVTVDMADLKRGNASVSMTDLLNQLPQFSATSSRFYNRSGIQTINLRGLGANRNLVLLDGHRLPLANSSGDVAINLIPTAAIQRVDVITGGASAVYGSGAISGVVNFITVPWFNGIRGDVQYGNTTKGDFFQQSVSTVLGSSFGDQDKGHVIVALGYTNSQQVLGSTRSFFNLAVPSSYLGTGLIVQSATNLPNQAVVNALFSGYGVATPVSNALTYGFNNDGTLFTEKGALNYKGPHGKKDFAILGGNVRMPVGPQEILAAPVTRKQAFTKFEYDFSSNVQFYGQFLFDKSKSKWSSGLSLTQFAVPTIPVTNPFIPSDLKTLLASRPDPNAPFTLKERYVGIPIRTFGDTYSTTQFLLGFKGNLVGQWTYDVHASHSMTDHTEQIFNAVLASRVQTLLDAPDGGDSICKGGFNPFGLNNNLSISSACRAFMTTTANSVEHLTQNIVQASIQGPVFTLPAGPVRVAFLGDIRRNGYDFEPSTALAAGDIEATQASAATRGATEVKELAVQTQIPILADMPLAKSLIIDAAYRYSKYRLSGGVNAYEGDIKWRPVRSLLVRGGYQRAVRAPNIGELFSAPTGVQVGIGTPPSALGDPCDVRSVARTGANGAKVLALCEQKGLPAAVAGTYLFPTTAVAGVQTGNQNLKPEKADTWNAGLQWTSMSGSALMGSLTLSLDYWSIDINNVISTVPGTTVLSKCYNLDGSNPTYSPDNEFCKLLTRNSDGLLTTIALPFLNLGELKSDGADFGVKWQPSLQSLGINAAGQLFVSNHTSYMHSYDIRTLANGPSQNFVNTISQSALASTALPRWKSITSVGFQNGSWLVGVRWNYLGSMNDISSVTNPKHPSHGVPSYSTFDLYGTYYTNHGIQVTAGITNLLDKGPLPVATSEIGTNPNVYDVLGRMYFVGLNFSI